MATQTQFAPAGASELSYLELLAYLGMTRHMGGWDATRELASLCQISKGKYVLDVGCGVGRTPIIFTKQYGCRMMGIDLSPRMVEWSRKRARSERVADEVELRVADAQQLPFEDGLFDAVFTESVMAFVPDRRKALGEFMRVTKPGGFIGLNESSWLQTPVPPELVEYLYSGFFSGARLETTDYWNDLLAASGLKDIIVSVHRITSRSDVRDRLKWFGVKGVVTNLYHIVTLSLSSPATRKAIKKIMAMMRNTPEDLYKYYGYGIYVGRKNEAMRMEV
jgi:ubiquinone/menaquinone biosynthesis C-methylase UbiE